MPRFCLSRRCLVRGLAGMLVLGLAGLAFESVQALRDDPWAGALPSAVPAAIPLAILGDSDSHAYQDRLAFGARPALRGGEFRATTFNWPEMLVRLAPTAFDPGPWGEWGNRHARYAWLRRLFGWPYRLPRKEDYRANFAVSGATCADLEHGLGAQLPALLRLLDAEPGRWRRGVVVVRIGINDIGTVEAMQHLARDPDAAPARAPVDACIAAITRVVATLAARGDAPRVVLVGIDDNADWPKYFAHWQDPVALANITRGLDRYDAALRALAAADPARRLFFDERAHVRSLIGSRDAAGRPAYRPLQLAPGFRLAIDAGDAPGHYIVADGHLGTVANGLFALALVRAMNRQFDWHLAEPAPTAILAMLPGARPDAVDAPCRVAQPGGCGG